MAHQRVRITKTTLQVRVALQKVQELFPLLSNHIQESAAMSPAGVENSSGAMSAHSTTDDLFCHFDRTGRFVLAAAPSLTIRRGLDNRLMRISIDTTHREDLKWFGRRRSYHDFSDVEKSDFYRAVYIEALTVLRHEQEASPSNGERKLQEPAKYGPATLTEWGERLARWTPAALAKDEVDFKATYKPISILPPDQYRTLVIQVAEGCSYNQCLFCDFYRDRRFHVKSPVELAAHLDAVEAFFGPRLHDRTGFFLGDGNALVVSADRLRVAIKQIQAAFGPETDSTQTDFTQADSSPVKPSPDSSHPIASFATFMDTFNLDKKSIEALHTLREEGIDTVYVGLESGYDPIRSFLKKPGPASEALAAIRTLKEAGYTVGPIVMIGVGDIRDADAHFEHTVLLLEEANLTPSDKIFLSPFVQPAHGEYRDATERYGVIPYTQDQIEREMMRWKDTLSKVTRAKVTGYYVREHIY